MSIKDIWQKIKDWFWEKEREISLVLLLVLVASFSFGLGRLSKIEELKEPVKIQMPQGAKVGEESGGVKSETNSAATVYASSRGKRYYFEWCGADKLSTKNKISFPSEAEAQKAGYIISSSCSN